MNAVRKISLSVTVSKSEIITALKAFYPTLINLQAIPSNGLDTTMEASGYEVTLKRAVDG